MSLLHHYLAGDSCLARLLIKIRSWNEFSDEPLGHGVYVFPERLTPRRLLGSLVDWSSETEVEGA